MDRFLELKTIISATFISLIAWVFTKTYAYFDVKIKRIDSVEELKKELKEFKEQYNKDNQEIKDKIDTIFNNLIK